MFSASEVEKRRNRELLKKLIRSLYFLVQHRIPHTTTFNDLITLQIENGDKQLQNHRDTSPDNATYLSKVTTSELLKSISHNIEEDLLARIKASQFSLIADESTDVASNEELSICARWIEDEKAVEHYLRMIRAH